MAHMTVRNGPCGLPDGHTGSHRTEAGVEVMRQTKQRYNGSEARRQAAARYNPSPGGKAKKARWNAYHPFEMALAEIKYRSGRKTA